MPTAASAAGRLPVASERRRVGRSIHRGRSYRTDNLVDEGGWLFLNLKCMARDGGFRQSGLKRYDGPVKQHQKAKQGDIIVALTDMTQERRIVARAARVPDLGVAEAVMSMDILRLEPLEPADLNWLYGTARWSGFPDEVKHYANGTNVLHLSPDRIAEYRVVRPSNDLRSNYSIVSEPMFRLQDNLERQNTNLRTTRDLLLPKLVSGEIDVSDLDIDTSWLVA